MSDSHSANMIAVQAPPLRLLVKLGSIIVHMDEASGEDGHPLDEIAIRSLLADREVQQWLAGMSKMGLLPTKRRGLP